MTKEYVVPELLDFYLHHKGASPEHVGLAKARLAELIESMETALSGRGGANVKMDVMSHGGILLTTKESGNSTGKVRKFRIKR